MARIPNEGKINLEIPKLVLFRSLRVHNGVYIFYDEEILFTFPQY